MYKMHVLNTDDYYTNNFYNSVQSIKETFFVIERKDTLPYCTILYAVCCLVGPDWFKLVSNTHNLATDIQLFI